MAVLDADSAIKEAIEMTDQARPRRSQPDKKKTPAVGARVFRRVCEELGALHPAGLPNAAAARWFLSAKSEIRIKRARYSGMLERAPQPDRWRHAGAIVSPVACCRRGDRQVCRSIRGRTTWASVAVLGGERQPRRAAFRGGEVETAPILGILASSPPCAPQFAV
jgi:hypothetical protein